MYLPLDNTYCKLKRKFENITRTTNTQVCSFPTWMLGLPPFKCSDLHNKVKPYVIFNCNRLHHRTIVIASNIPSASSFASKQPLWSIQGSVISWRCRSRDKPFIHTSSYIWLTKGPVKYICYSYLNHHWIMWWLVTCLVLCKLWKTFKQYFQMIS